MAGTEEGRVLNRLRELLIDGRFWMIYHAGWAMVWLVLFPPGMLLWPESVPFLMFVSLATALSGSLAGFGTALATRKADPEDPM